MNNIKRGDIFFADLGKPDGSRQGGNRPVVIVQNDIGNKYSPTVLVAPLTSRLHKHNLPTHVLVTSKEPGVERNSIIMMEQVQTLDKSHLQHHLGSLSSEAMLKVNQALSVSFGISS